MFSSGKFKLCTEGDEMFLLSRQITLLEALEVWQGLSVTMTKDGNCLQL